MTVYLPKQRLFLLLIEQCQDSTLRLLGEETSYIMNAEGREAELINGQLELCVEGKGYFSACQESFFDHDITLASTACSSFGYNGKMHMPYYYRFLFSFSNRWQFIFL